MSIFPFFFLVLCCAAGVFLIYWYAHTSILETAMIGVVGICLVVVLFLLLERRSMKIENKKVKYNSFVETWEDFFDRYTILHDATKELSEVIGSKEKDVIKEKLDGLTIAYNTLLPAKDKLERYINSGIFVPRVYQDLHYYVGKLKDMVIDAKEAVLEGKNIEAIEKLLKPQTSNQVKYGLHEMGEVIVSSRGVDIPDIWDANMEYHKKSRTPFAELLSSTGHE